jgi:hypothetical protein
LMMFIFKYFSTGSTRRWEHPSLFSV